MGELIYPLTLIGPEGKATLDALVDTGATFTWAPADTLRALGVPSLGEESFSLANGQVVDYDLGAVTVRINGKERPVVCVFGDEGSQPLIGVTTLENLLLIVDPIGQRLVPRPANLKAGRGLRGGLCPGGGRAW